MPSKKERKPDIYLRELSSIVHRLSKTIRTWEQLGLLPDHLIPYRDINNYRYWTHEQVYGDDGIIVWMEENNMRPGNLLTDPNKANDHCDNLRKPRLINGKQIRGVKMMIENGRDRKYIIRKLWPRTEYATEKSLETALVRYFNFKGWYFPPKQRWYPPRYARMERARLTGTPLYDMSNRRKAAKKRKKRRKAS